MLENITPIRQQYLRIKKKYPETIVFFRLGDFYETFDEDAKIASRELEIVLTSREMGKDNKIPLAGIPYHAVDNYLAKLINRGYKVAICEQLTKPGANKGIIDRDVIRVVTPGTVVEPLLLDSKANNYLTCLVMNGDLAGIAYVDITTSEFGTTQLPLSRVRDELERLKPPELIVPQDADLSALQITVPVTKLDNYHFETEVARQVLLEHFGTTTLDGYGCSALPLAISAAGALIHYVQETQKGIVGQLNRMNTYSTESFMAIDPQTQNNLELFRSSAGTFKGSLASVLDLTKTALGSRLIKRRLTQLPLDLKALVKRQDAVAWFVENTPARAQTFAYLSNVIDLERVINRVAGNNAGPRELVALKKTLILIPKMRETLENAPNPGGIAWLKNELKPQPEIVELIEQSMQEEPTTPLGEGGVIKPGFSEELDNLRSVSKNAKQFLANLERSEQEKTGIKNLKIGYNRVFGYYIEISKANAAQAPENYIRKQTLSTGERYFTPELKDYESTILNARERIEELETELFRRVCQQIATSRIPVLQLAECIEHVDLYAALAEVAVRYNYKRPTLTNGDEIIIKGGRHPVVERSLTDSTFVPNDTYLSNKDTQLVILTGPNMAGKSTYLKQVAIIVLLAQMGSFVPADEATIGLVDRIFTRIGAREDLAGGQSTFMVEMVEMAAILNNATPRSLLILDEIGRGTSTYDGLSIARAVAEYIHNSPHLGAKTLFATHYHEMVALADYLPRVKNYNVAVKEDKGEVIFLRKIVPGGVDKSYGIHVGKLAGLPKSVVHRAQEILDELEGDGKTAKPAVKSPPKSLAQIPLFAEKSPVLEELAKLEIDSLTPLEALTKLYELQKKAKE
jgi:DNA mismatch repair protein MutS